MEPQAAYEILRSKVKLEGDAKRAILDIIKTDPDWACTYAVRVIKGRWKEAEPFIKTNPAAASWYAEHAVGDTNFWRNQELLAGLMKSKPKSEPKTNSELDDLRKQREELDNRIKQLECA